MSEPRPLPVPRDLAEVLTSLLGKPVVAKRGFTTVTLEPDTKAIVAAYGTDDGALAAVCVCDMRLASCLGACLSLIPRTISADAARVGKLNESLQENLFEVLNVCCRVFNAEGFPHVSLRQIHTVPGPLPDDVAALLDRAAGRLGLDVIVPGYGYGQMVIRVA
jgi:hypothetical protein